MDVEASETITKRKWDERNKFIGEFPEQTLAQWTFRDQVSSNFELLSKMRDHQDSAIDNSTKLSPTSRERLAGWSIKDFLDCRLVHKPKMVMLEPSGRGWEPLTRGIEAIALMGGSFGEMITPKLGCRPSCKWASVLTGQDYLVVRHDILQQIRHHFRHSPVCHQPMMTLHRRSPIALFHQIRPLMVTTRLLDRHCQQHCRPDLCLRLRKQ